MTLAGEKRETAGIALETAATALRVTPAYLRRCERSGFPFPLATRAVRVYGCSLEHFLRRKERRGELDS